ncbi:MAG: MFS transporter [Candidatus Micrarchaeota archaeon]|nr:MFS transporter [Candidatus Micrarchaeota archaeon]
MRNGNVTFMLAVLLAYIIQGSIWYTMPLIFSHVLTNNYFAVGLLIALIPLVELLSAVPFGFFADFGRIKTIAFDSMLAILLVPFMFATNIELLIAVGAFLLGVGGMGIWIAVTAHMANVMGKNVRFIGYEFAVMAIGWITGPVLGGFVYGNYGTLPLTVAEMLFLAISSFMFLKTMRYASDTTYRRTPKFSKLLSVKDGLLSRIPRSALPLFIVSFLLSFFTYAIWLAVPLLTHIGNVSVLLGGIVIGVLNIPSFFGDALGGRLYRRMNRKSFAGYSVLLAAAFIFASAFLFGASYYSLIILFMSGLLITLSQVGMFSAIVGVDRRDTGEIAAISAVFGGFGGAISSVITGATIAQYSLWVFASAFGVMAVLYFLYLRFAFRKTDF